MTHQTKEAPVDGGGLSATLSEDALNALRAAAEKATPGPWGRDDSEVYVDDSSFMLIAETVPLRGDRDPSGWSPGELANAAFIAAANPATVLALLNEIEHQRTDPQPNGGSAGRVAELEGALQRIVEVAPADHELIPYNVENRARHCRAIALAVLNNEGAAG